MSRHTLLSLLRRPQLTASMVHVLGPVYIIFSAAVTIEPPEIRHVNTKRKHQCMDYQHKNIDASHKAPTFFKEQKCAGLQNSAPCYSLEQRLLKQHQLTLTPQSALTRRESSNKTKLIIPTLSLAVLCLCFLPDRHH